MKNYIIRDREAGNIIDTFNTIEEAKNQLEIWENEDKKDGSYTENFYEIVESKKTYTIREQDLYSLLQFAFIAGEHYQQDWSAEQIGEIEEITEPDFGGYFEQLDLKEFENK